MEEASKFSEKSNAKYSRCINLQNQIISSNDLRHISIYTFYDFDGESQTGQYGATYNSPTDSGNLAQQ